MSARRYCQHSPRLSFETQSAICSSISKTNEASHTRRKRSPARITHDRSQSLHPSLPPPLPKSRPYLISMIFASSGLLVGFRGQHRDVGPGKAISVVLVCRDIQAQLRRLETVLTGDSKTWKITLCALGDISNSLKESSESPACFGSTDRSIQYHEAVLMDTYTAFILSKKCHSTVVGCLRGR